MNEVIVDQLTSRLNRGTGLGLFDCDNRKGNPGLHHTLYIFAFKALLTVDKALYMLSEEGKTSLCEIQLSIYKGVLKLVIDDSAYAEAFCELVRLDLLKMDYGKLDE